MILKTIKLYRYDELSDEAKNRVKQWCMSDPDRSMLLTEDYRNMYLDYYFPKSRLEVQWSLGSCQGDGVNIYGELNMFDILAYVEKWNVEEHREYGNAFDPTDLLTRDEIETLYTYRERSGRDIDLEENHRYCYCVASRIDFVADMTDDLEYVGVTDVDQKLLAHFQENVVIPVIENLCREMEVYGYHFLYEMDDEYVQELCEANEWYFTEDGKFEVA